MSEQPTQRFERPPVPPVDPDAATTEYEPVYPQERPRDDYNPLFDPPELDPRPMAAEQVAAEPVAPPVAPVAPPVTEPVADPGMTRRLETTPPPSATRADRDRTAEPKQAKPQRPSAAATLARQWFSQSDNVLMAVTAAVAALFLVLVAILP